MLSALHALTFMCRSERENVDEDILAMGKGAYKVLVDRQLQFRRFDRACRWRLISCNQSISTRSRFVPSPYHWPSLYPPLTRHPQAVHSTPLNHIGLWVDDLPLAVQWLTSQACPAHSVALPCSVHLTALAGRAICTRRYSQRRSWL
jgi:hypothetical protein